MWYFDQLFHDHKIKGGISQVYLVRARSKMGGSQDREQVLRKTG